jgi:hypothetical protein
MGCSKGLPMPDQRQPLVSLGQTHATQIRGSLIGEPLVLPLAPPVGYVKVIPAG